MIDVAIRAEGLGKQYRIAQAQEQHNTLRDAIVHSARAWGRRFSAMGRGGGGRAAPDATIWALRDVSFTVAPGEVVGIIGANGAGKSTLLKLLSRITAPTAGEAVIAGRVGSLLEVGTGFHSELSGRENIFLNGAILGMKREEIARKFDEIVAFAEVDRFIDTPVKHYSSGMYLRLAFAVAAHLEPEILIVDEVLAVGDATFQKKCLGRMQSVAREGRTVLFVSHNMAAVSALCSRTIVLDSGRILFDGDVGKGLAAYTAMSTSTRGTEWTRPRTAARSSLQFTRIAASLSGEQPALTLDVELELESLAPHKPAFVAADLLHASGTPLMQALPRIDGFIRGPDGQHHLNMRVQLPPLVPGDYFASFWVGSHFTETLDNVEGAVSFEILDSPTPGRTYPHTQDHGYIVPVSEVEYSNSRSAEDARAPAISARHA